MASQHIARSLRSLQYCSMKRDEIYDFPRSRDLEARVDVNERAERVVKAKSI